MKESDAFNLTMYVHHLVSGCPVATPERDETRERLMKRSSVPGRIVEVNADTYWWYLEILPPRWIDGDAFCFAEGMEPLRLFWRRGSRYFCRQLNWEETFTFCDLAGIPRDYHGY